MAGKLGSSWVIASLARRFLGANGSKRGSFSPGAAQILSLMFIFFTAAFAGGQTIEYHGGYLINPNHVYFVWYGNWNNDTATSILPDLITGLNGSSYLNVLTSYSGKTAISSTQNVNEPLTNQVTFGGQVFDSYSYGSVIDDTATKDILTSHLGQFGYDPFGIYFLLTSADVTQTAGSDQFCYNYCGYHSRTFRGNINMAYAFVGNPAACDSTPFSCRPQNIGPNDNANADAMATWIVHEYAETITDVNGDAWYHGSPNPSPTDSTIGEMADLCIRQYGFPFRTGNNALANVTLGSRNFYLQELFAATGGCTLSYTPPPPPSGGGGSGGGGGCASAVPGTTASVALNGSTNGGRPADPTPSVKPSQSSNQAPLPGNASQVVPECP